MKKQLMGILLTLCMTLTMLPVMAGSITITPENPSVFVSVGVGNRVPITVTARTDSDVILKVTEYSNPYLYLFESAVSPGGYPEYTVKAGQTATVYVGSLINTAGTCTVTATFYSGEPPTTGPVALTLEKPSSFIEVKAGVNGRVSITATAPADGYIILTGDYDIWAGVDPAFYNQNGERLATHPNLCYKIPAGQTNTVFAGTYDNRAGTYTVRVTYHYIPNLLIEDKKANQTSNLLDDYKGQYRLVIFAGNNCPNTTAAVNYTNSILNNWSHEWVKAFVLNPYYDGWDDSHPNLVFSGDSSSSKGYGDTIWELLRPHGIIDVYDTPPVFITDKDGVIRYWHTGPISYESLQDALVSVVSSADPTPTAPTIRQQPKNISVTVGQQAGFSVLAYGYPSPTYQWQISTNNGSTWNNISGANNAGSPVIVATTSQSGNKYRCVVTNSLGSSTSNVATLTVTEPLTPVLTPENPSAVISAGAGLKGRVMVTLTAPAGVSFTLQSSGGAAKVDPTLYDVFGSILDDDGAGYPHFSHSATFTSLVPTVKVYAGTLGNTAATYTVTATFSGGGTNPNVVSMDRTRNRSSIIAMASSYAHSGFNKSKVTQYATTPLFSSPYNAGSLYTDDVADALNAMKMVRYIAGLPYENVAFTDERNNIAQHGAVLLAATNQYTHTPTKPADMPQTFFDLGYRGCDESNIFLGINANKNISRSILGWIADNGDYNIENAGHRRWVLRPDGQNFGIGFASSDNRYYSNLHVQDSSLGREADTYVAWPNSGDFPIQYFTNSTNINTAPQYPWSLNLGAEYQVPMRNEIQLTLTRTRDNKVWTFNAATPQLGVGNMPDDSMHLAVDNDSYGTKKAIIFRPDVTSLGALQEGDVFSVQLSGIKTKDGTPTTLEYSINFFDLDAAMQEDILTATTYQTIASPSGLRFTIKPRKIEKPLDNGKILLAIYEKDSRKMLYIKTIPCGGNNSYIIDTPVYSNVEVKVFAWDNVVPLASNEIINIP